LAMPLWIKEKLFQKTILLKKLDETLGSDVDWASRLLFSEHHLSHAASAFYPSPFKSAAILTLDGVGEWTTTSFGVGKGNELNLIKELRFPHSLGLLYSAFTYYLGFKVNSGEYKVMGLAPYGEPKYVELIKEKFVKVAFDGSFQLDMSYFDFGVGLSMTNNKFNAIFGSQPRKPETKITQMHMDIASSIQMVTAEIVIKLSKDIANITGEKNLCLAGGVALNCVVNGILLREKIFDKIWVQPAAGDAGAALGAALCIWYKHYSKERTLSGDLDEMKGSYLGPNFSNEEIKVSLDKFNANYIKLNTENLISKVAVSISQGKAVGWMQGRMEFGPRALGARSILADPRSSKMQSQLNLKVKYRENFRPFAPSILVEDMDEWFDNTEISPYMLFVSKINEKKCYELSPDQKALDGFDKLKIERSPVPAITHVDYTARVQTVHEQTNRNYYALHKKFKELTGCPILVNTSFNVRGEPIVCSPADAFKCFMNTDMDLLAIGNFLLLKDKQEKSLKESYEYNYKLD